MGSILSCLVMNRNTGPHPNGTIRSASATARDTTPAAIYSRANFLLQQFSQSGRPEDLEKAIDFLQQALNLLPEDPNRYKLLSNLGVALSQPSPRKDLRRAISLHQEVLDQLPVSHPDRSTYIDNLVSALDTLDSDLWTQYDKSRRPEHLKEVLEYRRDIVKKLPENHPSRSNYFNNLASALSMQFAHSRQDNDLKEAIYFFRKALESQPKDPQPKDPHRSKILGNLAILASESWTQFQKSGELKRLKDAISLYREALELLPKSHPHRYLYLTKLSECLYARFDKLGERKDLEEVISLRRKTLRLLPHSHPDRSASLTKLSDCLLAQFEPLGERKDLEEVVSLCREALKLLPDSPSDRSVSLNNLISALNALASMSWNGFKKSGEPKHMEEAISFYQEALKLMSESHPDRYALLINLSIALLARCEKLGERKDLEVVVSLSREAFKLLPDSPSDHSASLNNLISALTSLASMSWTQFKKSGVLKHMKEAISLYREALEPMSESHPNRYALLINLSIALLARFEKLGERKDLDEAISLYRIALKLSPGSCPEQCSALSTLASNLASTILTQCVQSGDYKHMDEAFVLNQESLKLRPEPHPDRYMSFNGLACAFSARFRRFGRREDLDNAIWNHRQALKLQISSHPDRSKSLSNLALALSQSVQLEDLKEAVQFLQEALELRSKTDPDRVITLSNLASNLWRIYGQLGKIEDLEQAISFHEQALKLRVASHPDQFKSLNNLALALWTRFTQSYRSEDIRRSIWMYQEALKLPATDVDLSMTHSNLALALLTRFQKSHQPEDLQEAMDNSNKSLKTLIRDHPSACSCLRNHGRIFIVASSHLKEPKHLEIAVNSYKDAVTREAAPASLRFDVAKEWASHADKSTHNSALEAYREAIQLLPRLAMFDLDLSSRQKALESGTDGLARDAAACAIRSKEYDRAVEFLEEGRTVFWSQSLQLRSPELTRLDTAYPEYAKELRSLSLALEEGSFRDASWSLSDDTDTVMSREQEAARFRHLNDKWQETLKEVRGLPTFKDFLCPIPISKLRRAADRGPLVILNASKGGCDALILPSSRVQAVQHVPLPDMTFDEAYALVGLLKNATVPRSRDGFVPKSVGADMKDLLRSLPDAPQPLKDGLKRGGMTQASFSDVFFPYVLEKLWKSVVEPVIRKLGLKISDRPPNLWWCPTGPFTFLPIHAAGIHDTKGECSFDYVVSSYTPTIGVLLRQPITTHPSKPSKMVVVTDPGLGNTEEELKRIEKCIPVTKANKRITKLVKLVSGTVEQVKAELPSTSIAHFACHGKQHVEEPLKSALLLKDHPLTVTMIYEAMLNSKSAGKLAFLAACQTAMGDKTLPDEVIHIGSSLLFSGFPGVVATLWNISDVDGPEVADAFYRDLFITQTGDIFHPHTTRAARALHRAVAKLRSDPKISFERWVPFIHIGW